MQFENLFCNQPGILHRILIHQLPEMTIAFQANNTLFGKYDTNRNTRYDKLFFQYFQKFSERVLMKLLVIFMPHYITITFLFKIALKRFIEVYTGLIGQAQ